MVVSGIESVFTEIASKRELEPSREYPLLGVPKVR